MLAQHPLRGRGGASWSLAWRRGSDARSCELFGLCEETCLRSFGQKRPEIAPDPEITSTISSRYPN